MKKFALIAAVVFAFGLTSCSKDFTCTCTTDDGQGNISTSSVVLEDTNRDDAEAACNASASAGGASATCELDD